MSEIIVGYDGFEGSRTSLEHAIGLARDLGDKVTVVFGAAAPGAVGGEMASHEEAVAEQGDKAMADASEQAQALGFEVDTRVVTSHPVQALMDVAEESSSRMIVVGNRGGESPLRGAILGSVPHKLLHLSKTPVLIVPT